MDFWPQFCAVLLVFGLLAGALWMLKRGNFLRFAALTRAGRKARLLQPLESLALTPQHSIHLVRVSGRHRRPGARTSQAQIRDGRSK